MNEEQKATVDKIKARRAAITTADGVARWQWDCLQIDMTIRDGQQANLYAYKEGYGVGVSVISAFCDGHKPEDQSVPNPIQIKDADAFFIENAPDDIDALLQIIAAQQADIARLTAEANEAGAVVRQLRADIVSLNEECDALSQMTDVKRIQPEDTGDLPF